MNRRRTVRAYGNRRLYDPAPSRYITYDDVGAMLREGIAFDITEFSTGKDITRKILIEILMRHELQGGGNPVFTESSLRQLIQLGATELALLTREFLNYAVRTEQLRENDTVREMVRTSDE